MHAINIQSIGVKLFIPIVCLSVSCLVVGVSLVPIIGMCPMFIDRYHHRLHQWSTAAVLFEQWATSSPPVLPSLVSLSHLLPLSVCLHLHSFRCCLCISLLSPARFVYVTKWSHRHHHQLARFVDFHSTKIHTKLCMFVCSTSTERRQ